MAVSLKSGVSSLLVSASDNGCSTDNDRGIPLLRDRTERKTIAAVDRLSVKEKINNINADCPNCGAPRKSQSVSDLQLFKIKSSATVTSNSSTNSAVGSVKSMNGSVDMDSHLMTSKKSIQAQQQRSPKNSTASFTVSSPPTCASTKVPEEVNGGRKVAQRERRFRRLFRNVPTTEILICRYSCAYVSDMGLLLQGHLYLSNCWICFHSNVFGIEKIIEIPVESIITVAKAHTAKIIPNAVRIKTPEKYYLFGSLISRDSTYRMLVDIVSKGQQHEECNCPNECETDPGSYSPVIKSPPDVAVDESDRASLSSGLSSDTGSISPTDETAVRRESLPNEMPAPEGSNVEKSQPMVWRRFFMRHASMQKNQLGSHRKGNDSQATNSALADILAWFCGLPKTLALLIICVVLVAFLFLCASILTIRLMYLRASPSVRVEAMPWVVDSSSESILLSHRTLDSMTVVLDSTLTIMDEVKRHLANLRMEIRNGLREGIQLASVDERS